MNTLLLAADTQIQAPAEQGAQQGAGVQEGARGLFGDITAAFSQAWDALQNIPWEALIPVLIVFGLIFLLLSDA